MLKVPSIRSVVLKWQTFAHRCVKRLFTSFEAISIRSLMLGVPSIIAYQYWSYCTYCTSTRSNCRCWKRHSDARQLWSEPNDFKCLSMIGVCSITLDVTSIHLPMLGVEAIIHFWLTGVTSNWVFPVGIPSCIYAKQLFVRIFTLMKKSDKFIKILVGLN